MMIATKINDCMIELMNQQKALQEKQEKHKNNNKNRFNSKKLLAI